MSEPTEHPLTNIAVTGEDIAQILLAENDNDFRDDEEKLIISSEEEEDGVLFPTALANQEDDEANVVDFERLSEDEARQASLMETTPELDNDFVQWIMASDEGSSQEEMEGKGEPVDELEDRELLEGKEHEYDQCVEPVSIETADATHMDPLADPWPERLLSFSASERRARLGFLSLHDSLVNDPERSETFVQLNRTEESKWVTEQLFRPDWSLHGSFAYQNPPRLHALTNAVEIALHLMIDKGLEPATLFLYYQTPLMPLLQELWDLPDSQTVWKSAEDPLTSAFCSKTGVRSTPYHLPHFKTGPYIGFDLFANSYGSPNVQIRRPATVKLGRLLWEILELDGILYSLERQRQIALHRLHLLQVNDIGFVQEAEFLKTILFHDTFDATVWGRYTHFTYLLSTLKKGSSSELPNQLRHSPTAQLLLDGHRSTLLSFAPTAQRFHQHLLSGGHEPIHYTSHPKQVSSEAWVRSLFQDGTASASALGALLIQLVNAVAEQLSQLPKLLRNAYQVYHTDGVLQAHSGSTHRSFRLADLTTSASTMPRFFLELLEAQSAGHARLSFSVPPLALLRATKLNEFSKAALAGIPPEHLDDWRSVFDRVCSVTLRHLQLILEPCLRQRLRQLGLRCYARATCETLDRWVSQGPFCRVKLASGSQIPSLDDSTPLWDESACAVETLPQSDWDMIRLAQSGSRVCGVVQEKNGSLVFLCLSEESNLCAGSPVTIPYDLLRLTHFNPSSPIVQQFSKFLLDNAPDVLVVGVSDCDSHRLLYHISHVLSRLSLYIPLVLGPLTIARILSEGDVIYRMIPDSTDSCRLAAALALSTQHPLHSIAVTFDQKRTALMFLPAMASEWGTGVRFARSLSRMTESQYEHLANNMSRTTGPASARFSIPPYRVSLLTSAGISRATSYIYRWMEWNLSLWMSATGVRINQVLLSPFPESILQFVAGLGPSRAAAFVDHACATGGHLDAYTGLHNAMGFMTFAPNNMATASAEDIEHLQNIVSGPLRMVPITTTGDFETLWEASAEHVGNILLAETLLPASWIEAAFLLLRSHLQLSDSSQDLSSLILRVLLQLYTQPILSQRATELQLLNIRRHLFDLCAADIQRLPSLEHFGVRECELVFDQLLALGIPTMLRFYRPLTKLHFFRLVTGVLYRGSLSKRPRETAKRSHTAPKQTFMATEGSLVKGVIVGHKFLSPSSEGVLELQLDNGCIAELSSRTLRDLELRQELVRTCRDRFQTQYSPHFPLGAQVTGIVAGIHLGLCRIQLAWVDAPRLASLGYYAGAWAIEADAQSIGDFVGLLSDAGSIQMSHDKFRTMFKQMDSASMVLSTSHNGESSRREPLQSDARSDLSTKPRELVEEANAMALHGTLHVIFRDWSRSLVESSLLKAEVAIGEAALRRARASHSSRGRPSLSFDFYLVFKVGDATVTSVPLIERRNAQTGKREFVLNDFRFGRITTHVYESIDHCLVGFVHPLCRFVDELRRDVRFHPTLADAHEALVDSINVFPTRIAYVFVEVSFPSGVAENQTTSCSTDTHRSGRCPTLEHELALFKGSTTSKHSQVTNSSARCPYVVLYCAGNANEVSVRRIGLDASGLWLEAARSIQNRKAKSTWVQCTNVIHLRNKLKELLTER